MMRIALFREGFRAFLDIKRAPGKAEKAYLSFFPAET